MYGCSNSEKYSILICSYLHQGPPHYPVHTPEPSINPFVVSSSIISFRCYNVNWTNGVILQYSWDSSHCQVYHRQSSIGTNIYGWNTVNSVCSIRSYIIAFIILLPTILCSLLSSTHIRSFKSLCILIRTSTKQALTQIAEITFAAPNMCFAIFPLYHSHHFKQ
jgi:hypothetical protein